MNDPLINWVYQPFIDIMRLNPKRAARECLRGFVFLMLINTAIGYSVRPDFWAAMFTLFGWGFAATFLRTEQLKHPSDNWKLMLFRYFFLMVAVMDGENVIAGWVARQPLYSIFGGFVGDLGMITYASMMFFDWCKPPPPPVRNLRSSLA